MIIAQISDSHIDPESPNGDSRLRDLEACVSDINDLDPIPDLVIHTGDVAHNGDEAKYRLASEILGRLKCPLFVAAGNRDERALLATFFPTGRNLMPGSSFRQYAVDDFPVRIIALDTISDHGNQGDYCEERVESLRRTLAEDTSRPTVLFMHHPPYEIHESKYPRQYAPWDGAGRIAAALQGKAHVFGLFCGHAHRDTKGEVAGIPAYTVASVARDLRLGDFGEISVNDPIYRLHRLGDEGVLASELRAASTDGQS